MTTPSELVTAQFALAQSYASTATAQLATFTAALDNAIYAPPTIDIAWSSVSSPTIPSIPAPPSLPTVSFTAPTAPGAFTEVAPIVAFDTFSESAPVQNFPVAPILSYGTAPVVPDVGAISVPDAPVIDVVAIPTYLALSTPTFAGVNLHEDYLANLDNIPTLALVEPTPYSYLPGPEYASTLLSNLQAVINTRLAGGTGLSPAVEAAIWDRARARETNLSAANMAEIMRASEALGFYLPAGVLVAQLREAQQNYYDKASGLSRDIAIKQAELEQENLKQAIAVGMELEGKLITYSYQLEQLTFESAKTAAENSIGIHNALVEEYKALLEGFKIYAMVYRTIIDAETMKVTVYKAEIDGEQAKASVNMTLVQQYKAQIEASLALVEVYKAQISGANALIQLESTKISAAGEQVKAYVAQVNAETAKIEAYKAGVQAETAKMEGYKIKADVFGTVVNAQAEEARLRITEYSAKTAVKSQEWDGYRALLNAASATATAQAAQSSSLTDGYRAAASAAEAAASSASRQWETQIKQYEAGLNIAILTAKTNNEAIMNTNAVRVDAAKVGAQVYAQLASSSYTMANANATVSGTGGTNVSYSYSNDTLNQPAGIEVI